MNLDDTQEKGFIALARAAGINMSPEIIKVIVGLLSENVPPEDIYQLLRGICLGQQHQMPQKIRTSAVRKSNGNSKNT